MLKSAIRRCVRALGFDLVRYSKIPLDFSKDEIEIIEEVTPWTMTSPERIGALIHAVQYVGAANVPGAIVECGVWKGGSMAAVAKALLLARDTSRELYLFDTFIGMPEPTGRDSDYLGKQASDLMARELGVRCADAPLKLVQDVLARTGYPQEKIHFVVGDVAHTIPVDAPKCIALLRLDTDWYESTIHELRHLFPRLSKNGVIIIDDYGHWRGSRQACDEYFGANKIPILLNRIDYTGRIAVKP